MTEDDLNLYVIAEHTYEKKHENEDNLFPVDFYSSKNYKLKIEIITEAIKKGIRIEDTDLYQNKFIEGTK